MRAKHDPELIERFAALHARGLAVPIIRERLCIGKGHAYRLLSQIRARGDAA